MELSEFGRPLFCTEWMARLAHSTIKEQLPLFARHKVASFQWGLVNGRTQTHLPWPQLRIENPSNGWNDREWFHDLLRSDGTPYSVTEAKLIREVTKSGDSA
jgi:hypothetical protein